MMTVSVSSAPGKILAMFVAVLIFNGVAAPARADNPDNAMENIAAVQQSDGTTVRFTFKLPPSSMPRLFVLDSPPRLVLDFNGLEPGERLRNFSFNDKLLKAATIISVPDRTRVVLALHQPVRHVLRLQGQELLLALVPAPLEPAVAVAVPAADAAKGEALAAAENTSMGKKNTPHGPGAETLLVELTVNGQEMPGIVRADRLADGRMALPLEAWRTAGLRPAGDPVTLPDKQRGYALESVANLAYHVDRASLVLALTVPAAAFDSATYSLGNVQAAPANSGSVGMYLNYSLAATRQQPGSSAFGGSVESVVFSGASSLVSGVVVHSDSQASSVMRTDTYWRRDWPAEMRTLVLGDAMGGDGGWSRPVRYGGVRYGRDFTLAPGYISYPLPAISGSAALPSTVDVLVNNQRQSSANIKAGPFDLTNVPVVSGAGEINLVVRDLRGVETVLTQSYYSTQRLLAAGLSDFSAESGALRRNYGSASNDYGRFFAAGSYRYGFTQGLTVAGRAELQRTRQAGGVEATGLLGTLAVGRVAFALSHSADDGSDNRSGRHWLAAIERMSPRAGGAIQWDRFDAGFEQFGADAGELRPKNRLQANIGIALGGGRSAGLSYVRQANWNGEDFALAGANLGIALAGNVYLSVYGSQQRAAEKSWSGGLNLIVPLGNQRTVVATSDRDRDGKRANVVQASSLAPPGEGWGWSLRASDTETRMGQAGVTLNSAYARLTADASVDSESKALRIGADGSAGWFEGLTFATRRIEQGAFAVVRVGDIEGVAVSRSNQVMATTNSKGLALVPGLLPYQTNVLTVDPDKLPMGINIGSVERLTMPHARSGVLLDFPVRRSRNVLATLQQENGAPVPPGARVKVSPGNQQFIVAKRGKVYLTDVHGADHIDVRWDGGSCTLPLVLDAVTTGETEVGPLICGSHK
jgi:outer membrane usher protein